MCFQIEDIMIFDSPSEMFEGLQETDCCKKILTERFVKYSMKQYVSYYEGEDREKEEAKEYIIYALACILNELRPIPEDELDEYYYEPDELLNDVIEFASFRRCIMT